MNDERIDILKNEKISKAVNKMAAPAIVGMLIMAIYNVVDSIFISWIGPHEIGAIQVVLPIMLISSAVGLSLGIGGGTYVSRLIGQNNLEESNKVASVSFFTGLIVGTLLVISSLLFLDPILELFGSDENTHNLANIYGTYIVIGFTFTVLNMVMNNMLRSEGSAKFSMIGMGVGSIFNIILDPILIFGLDMGIAGAAIATTVSQGVTTLILFSMYFRKKSIIKISLAYFKPTIEIYKQILLIGIPTFFRQMLVSISLGLLNNAATEYGGTDLLNATSIAVKVTMIPNYIIFGFGQGFQPVAGYNVGAKNKERVRESLRYTLKVSVVIMIAFFIIINVFNDQIFDIFKASDSVREYGKDMMFWYLFGFIFLGISNTISTFYQALGKGGEALLLSVSRQGLFFIPLIVILPMTIGLQGVIISQAISDVLTCILCVSLVIPFTKSDKLDLLIAGA